MPASRSAARKARPSSNKQTPKVPRICPPPIHANSGTYAFARRSPEPPIARGTVTKKFTVEVDKSSAAAKEKLESAGGSLILRERQTKVAARAVVKAAPRKAVKA